MPVQKGQRLKLLKIWEILKQETDENHTMGTPELLSRLEEVGIVCDRRTLYSDINALNESGYRIYCVRSSSNEYYVEHREFSMAEIQILMDAVQAASFITEEKTKQLVNKIAELAGSRRAEVVKRNAVAFNTTKSANEEIFDTVSTITDCIEKYKKVEFKYFDYNISGKRTYRKDEKVYKVNPVATIFSDDKYYLLCYDDKHSDLAHYRVDRMDNVNMSLEEITPSDKAEIANIQKHKRQLFGMYNGDECEVTIEADISLTDAIYDKFGFGTKLTACSNNRFRFSAVVQLSPVFFGWCCSFGDMLRVIAPNEIVVKFKDYLSMLEL